MNKRVFSSNCVSVTASHRGTATVTGRVVGKVTLREKRREEERREEKRREEKRREEKRREEKKENREEKRREERRELLVSWHYSVN
jgi:hypothetical protein